MTLDFTLAETKHDLAWCFHIRTLVFVIGQQCPPDIEIDAHEDACRHLLARTDGRPCATARWRRYGDGIAKIERVAVLEPWRGRGIGSALMRAVIADVRSVASAATTYRLGSQDQAIPFYERLGFTIVGEGFMDAGIPHHWMQSSPQRLATPP